MLEKRSRTVPTWLIIVAIVLLGVFGLFLTGKQPAGVRDEGTVSGKTETVRIPVQGMTCAVCAANVKQALRSVKGVQGAEIDLGRREARVRYAEGKVSFEKLVTTIDQLGYKAGKPVLEAPR